MANIPSVSAFGCTGNLSCVDLGACDSQPGKVAFIAIVSTDYTFTDISDPAEWATAISAGDITICKSRGDVPRGSVITQPGFGRQKFTVVGYDYTGNFQLENPDGNGELANRLLFEQGKTVFFITPDFQAFIPMDEDACFLPVTFDAAVVIPGEENDQRFIDVVTSWSVKQALYSSPVPASVFTAL